MANVKGLDCTWQNMMLTLVSIIILSIGIDCNAQSTVNLERGNITTPVTFLLTNDETLKLRRIEKYDKTIIFILQNSVTVVSEFEKILTCNIIDTMISITIHNATLEDAGNYTLYDYSIDPPEELFLVQLYIMGTPLTPVVTIENNGTVKEGKGKLKCETSSTSMPPGYDFTYTWRNNDQVIGPDNTKYTFEGQGGTILAINVDRNEIQNVYTCSATELHGLTSDISSVGRLNPYRSPLVNMEHESSVYKAIEFSSVSLNCIVTDGNPTNYTFNWWSHGSNLNINSSVLMINNVSRVYTGQYNCSVENGIGIAGKDDTKLDILYGPKISSKEVISQEDGHSLKVSCTVDSNPTPKDADMTWVRPNNSTFNNTGLHLMIPKLNRKDNGTFFCNVRVILQSSDGVTVTKSASATVQINVLYGPTITPMDNQYIEEGTDAAINCNSLSNPSAKTGDYLWTKQGNVSFSQKGPTLFITNIDRMDRGTFFCTVNITLKPTNRTEFMLSDHQSVQIDVLYGPMITHMTTYSQEEGKNVSVKCEILSNPTANNKDVTWTKEEDKSFKQPGLELYLPFVNKNDKGTYVCHVRIGLQLTNGTVVMRNSNETLKINVLYGPIIQPLSNQSLKEGENITVNCIVQSNPSVTDKNVRWGKQGNSSFSQNGLQLYIPSVNREDNGLFVCRIVIEYNTTDGQLVLHNTMEMLHINVKYQPNITHLGLITDHIVEGNDTTAICQADGNPRPTIFWLYLENNTAISKDYLTYLPYVQWNHVSNQLKISSARCEDTGTYVCLADNGILSPTNRSVRLNVECKPRLSIVVNEDKNVTIGRNESLEYTAMFHAFPEPSFKWAFNKTKLMGFNVTNITDRLPYKSGSKIQKSEITDEDIGLYEVIANNSAGQAKASFYIIFQREPDQPLLLSHSCTDRPKSAKIEWAAGQNGGLEQRFIIQYKNQTDEHFINAKIDILEDDALEIYSEFIDSLIPGSTYIFRVKALNAKGGSVSIEVNCTVVDVNKSKTTSAITTIIVVVSIICILTILGGVGGVYLIRRRTATKKKHKQLIERPSTNNRNDTADDELTENPLYVSSEPIATENGNGIIYSVVEKKKQKVQPDGIMVSSEPSVYAEVVKRQTKEKSDKSIEMGYVNANSEDMNNTKEDNVYANANTSNQITAREKQEPTKNKDGLIYADLDLAIEPNGSRFVIRGLENRNNYAVIDLTKTAEPLPSDSGSEDENTSTTKKTLNIH